MLLNKASNDMKEAVISHYTAYVLNQPMSTVLSNLSELSVDKPELSNHFDTAAGLFYEFESMYQKLMNPDIDLTASTSKAIEVLKTAFDNDSHCPESLDLALHNAMRIMTRRLCERPTLEWPK